jgi:hypothetical protein
VPGMVLMTFFLLWFAAVLRYSRAFRMGLRTISGLFA